MDDDLAYRSALAQANFSLQLLEMMRHLTQLHGSFTKADMIQHLSQIVPPAYASQKVDQVLRHFHSMLRSDGERYAIRDDTQSITETMALFRNMAKGADPES